MTALRDRLAQAPEWMGWGPLLRPLAYIGRPPQPERREPAAKVRVCKQWTAAEDIVARTLRDRGESYDAIGKAPVARR